ncbi:hypothetical protein [Mobilicoccus pelagius]|uniref:Uncharacterized protein n=1 Tax=Mobilicoccus pelagius NBRC 104925 TaxID=1089455 RepID=H5UMP4_9MICO|nr:hypothetical protein [Mobilicoccus pelagius]GAB47002.1 hypothetical protein MOPEL_003_00250 [Mobilicoccus pelagius NBRC 104925]
MSEAPCPSRRQILTAGLLTAGSAGVLAACSSSAAPSPGATATTTRPASALATTSGPPEVDSWAPAPRHVGGLSVVASQKDEQLLLHTAGGDRTFWAGVGLAPTLPGKLASEHAPAVKDYRRWFAEMTRLGIRVVRLDSLQAPALYEALHAHNTAEAEAPLYLLQGVTIPALSSPTGKARPLGSEARTAMRAEISDTSAAVHGDLRRPGSARTPRATWKADVSPWVAGWLVGSPWDPATVLATDRAGSATPFSGTYFRTTAKATVTEAWIAARMDELATHEAKRGSCAPIGAANHAATDPLSHPEEPVADDDRVGVDVNRIGVLTAWPAGTFAAYRAYPNAPKFLRFQPSYTGTADPFRAYLGELRAHHAGRPLLVTETGVPASLGRSHTGAQDRHEGFLTEQQAMKVDADLLVLARDLGLAGGLLRSWTDDWSAVSAPTAPRTRDVPADRRVLTHDPLTSAQWFGLLAHDQVRAGERVVHAAPEDEMARVVADHDASYLYLTFFFTRRVTSPVDLGFDLYGADGLRLPGGSGEPVHDVSLHFVPTMSTVTMSVRRTLDPTRLDGLPSLFLPRPTRRGWVEQQLTLAPPLQVPGRKDLVPAEMQKIGDLVLGSWDPAAPDYTSLATWQLVRPAPTSPMEWRLRLPWSMLTFADPSRRLGLVPEAGEPTLVPVRNMDVTIESSTPGSPASFTLAVPTWNEAPRTTERLRAGSDALRAALTATTSGRPTE